MSYRRFKTITTSLGLFLVTTGGVYASIQTIKLHSDDADHSASPDFPLLKAESRMDDSKWISRFRSITKQVKTGNPEIVFLGDSITHGWKFTNTWKKEFGKYQAVNAGISSDQVQNLLWRVQNGNFDDVQPKLAIILIGINNLALNTPLEIAGGINQVTKEIHKRSPKTKVLLLSVLPSGQKPTNKRRKKIDSLNENIELISNNQNIFYLDIGKNFVNKDGTISRDIMFDYLHLTHRGYKIFAESMKFKIESLLISH